MERSSIAAEELTKIYPNGTCAVRGVSFAVGSEDLMIILGPSGAGKSTLLRCLNRLLEPTSGRVILNDRNITHVGGMRLQEVRRRVGIIFQQFNLVGRLSVLENVLAGRLTHCGNVLWHTSSLFRLFPKREKEFAFDCLRTVRIEQLAYQRADTLSGGQMQRVAIARALAQEPYVFLADEPVASLDPASAEIVMETLQDIQETQHIPVIVNLHQIGLAERYAKRMLGMADGEKVFEGGTRALTPEVIERIYGVEVDPKTGRPKGRRKTQLEARPVLQPDEEKTPPAAQDLKATASG